MGYVEGSVVQALGWGSRGVSSAGSRGGGVVEGSVVQALGGGG